MTPLLQLTAAAAERIWNRRKWKPAWWIMNERRLNPIFDPNILAGKWSIETTGFIKNTTKGPMIQARRMDNWPVRKTADVPKPAEGNPTDESQERGPRTDHE